MNERNSFLKRENEKNMSENEMDENERRQMVTRGQKNWRENIMLNGNRIVLFYITAVGSDNDSMKMTLMNLVDCWFFFCCLHE